MVNIEMTKCTLSYEFEPRLCTNRTLAFGEQTCMDINLMKIYISNFQAHGLSFSVPEGIGIPPSLKNIYKELETDIPGFKQPSHGCLEKWAQQGVLLLNATLTVEQVNFVDRVVSLSRNFVGCPL